jgi:hypothetical protein
MRGIEMRIEHTLSERIRARRAVEVLVVGAGGTGSAILMGLPYLHQAMRVWGHPYGLRVTLMDPDVVSAREEFTASKGVNFTHESYLAGIRAETGARGKSESCSGSPAAGTSAGAVAKQTA